MSTDFRAFLADDTTTHIMQQGMTTTVLTKLGREALVEYLDRLRTEIASRLDSDDLTDIVEGDAVDLPTGDKVFAVHMQVRVF
jgi:hypothetical protein